MRVAVCIPTLIRYDLLAKTLYTAENGNVVPDAYYIVDNGLNLRKDALPETAIPKVEFKQFGYNIGVAASWNVLLHKAFSQNTFAIVCNDDIEFYPETIEKLIGDYDEKFISFPGGSPSGNSFSCFLIPENIYKTVGDFDEDISPQYAYFEDNDYHYRMKLLGFDIRNILDCRLGHVGSATINSMPAAFQLSHHGKFRVARDNYIRKWGGMPGQEVYTTPFNR